MTVKNLLNTYSMDEILEFIDSQGYTMYFDELMMFKRVYDIFKESSGNQREESITFLRVSNGKPLAVMVDKNDEYIHLVARIPSIVNCEISDTENNMTDIEMLSYVILHYVALELGETPYIFLERLQMNIHD